MRTALVLRVTALALAVVCTPLHAQTGDPRTFDECVQMTRAPLEQRCSAMFASAGQGAQRAACLEQVVPQLEAVCESFFGEGRDFCTACTSGCNQAFPPGDGQRRECLQMCLQQPGCR